MCFLLASCALLDLGRITEIDSTPPNRPPVEPEYVAEFAGKGIMNTALFTVDRNWYMMWLTETDDSPAFYIYDASGELYDICGGTMLGYSYFYGTGTYYIKTLVSGYWAIIVDYQ